MPGSSRSVVAEAKDLNPFTVRLLRCTDLRGSAGRCCAAIYPQASAAAVYAALRAGATRKRGKKLRAATCSVEARFAGCVL
jgi:hypothetical protein